MLASFSHSVVKKGRKWDAACSIDLNMGSVFCHLDIKTQETSYSNTYTFACIPGTRCSIKLCIQGFHVKAFVECTRILGYRLSLSYYTTPLFRRLYESPVAKNAFSRVWLTCLKRPEWWTFLFCTILENDNCAGFSSPYQHVVILL